MHYHSELNSFCRPLKSQEQCSLPLIWQGRGWAPEQYFYLEPLCWHPSRPLQPVDGTCLCMEGCVVLGDSFRYESLSIRMMFTVSTLVGSCQVSDDSSACGVLHCSWETPWIAVIAVELCWDSARPWGMWLWSRKGSRTWSPMANRVSGVGLQVWPCGCSPKKTSFTHVRTSHHILQAHTSYASHVPQTEGLPDELVNHNFFKVHFHVSLFYKVLILVDTRRSG